MSPLPKQLIERASSTPQKVAWREFRFGVWNERTWASVHEEAAAIGTGLAALGLEKGDVVAILATNSVVAISGELGAQGIGCVAAVLSSDLAPSTVRNVLGLIQAKAVLVSDQEQFDKVADAGVESVRATVVFDARGFREIEVAGRPDAERVLTIGQLKNRAGTISDWDSRATSLQGSDPAAILCTIDRSSAEVEVRRFSHDALAEQAAVLVSATGATVSDIVAVQTSLADATEHTMSVVGPLVLGFPVNIGQPDLATQSMRQIQPTLVASNRSWLEGTAAEVERRAASAKGLKGMAAKKGLVPRPPVTTALRSRIVPQTRIVGVAAAVLSFLFLLVSTSMNDFVRLMIVLAIALIAGLTTVVTGSSAVSAARRAVGLSRARAVVHDGTIATESSPGAVQLLGTLGVPVVVVTPSPGEILGRIRSEVLA